MTKQTLRQTLTQASDDKVAIGHFNAGTFDTLRAIVAAAEDVHEPVIIGVSEGERDAFGVRTVVALIAELRTQSSVPIFLNADHTYSVERVKEAIDAGFDAVIYDGANLPYEENLANTKACVEYARASGKDVLVEAELGFIGSGSQIIDAIPEGAAITEEMMTKPEDARRFVQDTGIDLFAPSVGNIHGMLKGAPNPALSARRVKEIREACGVPLVLHGGSGISDGDFVDAIEAGVAIVHISTEIRKAYRHGLETSLSENQKELAPYKYLAPAAAAAQDVTMNRLKLFSRKQG